VTPKGHHDYMVHGRSVITTEKLLYGSPFDKNTHNTVAAKTVQDN